MKIIEHNKGKEKNKRGFSLNELLIVIAVMGVLASIVLINIFGAKQDAKDSSALQSMTAVAPLAYKCLVKAGKVGGGRLTAPNTLNGRTSLCVVGAALDEDEFPAWPDISDTGWGYDPALFKWCSIGYSGNDYPSGTALGSYDDGQFGGKWETGEFCFMLCDTNCSDAKKWIWCTDKGCHNQGIE